MAEPSIDPDLNEMLVAYLDGELGPDEARQVEQLVASDPRVESHLRRLERAWKLLDELPRAEVDPSFTRSTVEMAALVVEEEELAPRSAGRFLRTALAGGVLACTALIGFAAARLWPDDNRTLLRNLPVVEHLEGFRQTPGLDFLRQFEQEGLFADGPPASFAAAASLEDRRRQLASLSPDQRDELHRKYERFTHLPPDEQARLRDLESAMNADDRRAALETTLAAYDHWLEHLSGVERAELMAIDATARFERVKRLHQEEARRLTAEDGQAFVAWVEQRLAKWLDDKPGLKHQLQSAPEGRRRELLARVVNEFRRSRPQVFTGTFGDRAARDDLRQRLSPRGQQQLDLAQTPDQRRVLLQSWFLQTFSPPATGRGQLSLPKVDEAELRRFFEHDLDPARRTQLLNLPADQMRRQLLRLYHMRQARQAR